MPATPKQKVKIERVMHEFKEGGLRSSSGAPVTKRKQAIAVALSESGRARPTAKKPKTAKSQAT